MKPEGPPPKTDLIGRISAWVLQLPPVRWLKPIMDDYGAAGGGLLASGVAFNSLFAVLPAILLIVSLLGLYLDDPLRLEQLVQAFARQFPPLEEFFRQALDQFRAGAVSFSVLGAIGLVWGSSRFYQSLDEAIARIFRGSRERDPIQRGLRGILSVGLLVGAVVGAVGFSQVVNDVRVDVPGSSGVLDLLSSSVGSILGTVLIFAAVVGVIYRMVPTETPSSASRRRPGVCDRDHPGRPDRHLRGADPAAHRRPPRIRGVRGGVRGHDLAVVPRPGPADWRGVGPSPGAERGRRPGALRIDPRWRVIDRGRRPKWVSAAGFRSGDRTWRWPTGAGHS